MAEDNTDTTRCDSNDAVLRRHDDTALKRHGNALKRYDVIMAQLRYDYSAFWTRFGFMIVSQIATFSLFINVYLATSEWNLSPKLLARLPFCVIGLLLVWFFYRLHRITDWWIRHWIVMLENIEGDAFGEMELFRNVKPPGSARTESSYFIWLFCLAWVVALTISWI